MELIKILEIKLSDLKTKFSNDAFKPCYFGYLIEFSKLILSFDSSQQISEGKFLFCSLTELAFKTQITMQWKSLMGFWKVPNGLYPSPLNLRKKSWEIQ